MESIHSIVQQFIQQNDLAPKRGSVLVAISGGPDSVFLAHSLLKQGFSIGLAHVNYQLRGKESDLDEALIRDYATQWAVPCYVHHAAPKAYAKEHQVSVQVACREIRYAFFEKLLAEHPYEACATAHHADDQIETLLMSLIKGNSPSIFKGIPTQRGPYIRPLLPLYKDQILNHLDAQQLSFRIDHTNLEKEYFRNQIRHDLIPLLEQSNPSARSNILRLHHWHQKQSKLLAQMIRANTEKLVKVNPGSKQIHLDPLIQSYGLDACQVFLAQILTDWGIHGHEIWQCLDLLHSQSGKWVQTSAGRLLKDRKGFTLLLNESTEDVREIQVPNIGEQKEIKWHDKLLFFTQVPSYPAEIGKKNIYYLDLAQVQGRLQLRSWIQKDRMIPLGMKQSKKLSDIFVDEKYDPLPKNQAWVLSDESGIICLGGFRIADRVRLTTTSRNILMIQETPIKQSDSKT